MRGHKDGHVEDRIQAWLEGELAEAQADAVRGHIDGCESCSRAMEQIRATLEALRADAKADAGPLRPMWPAVRAATSPEARPRFGLSFGLATSLAAAAGILIGLALGSADRVSRRAEEVDSQYAATILGDDYDLTLDGIYTSVPDESEDLK